MRIHVYLRVRNSEHAYVMSVCEFYCYSWCHLSEKGLMRFRSPKNKGVTSDMGSVLNVPPLNRKLIVTICIWTYTCNKVPCKKCRQGKANQCEGTHRLFHKVSLTVSDIDSLHVWKTSKTNKSTAWTETIYSWINVPVAWLVEIK